MAAISTIVAIVGLAASAVGLVQAADARSDSKKAQEKLRSEQRAGNAASAAQERRQQIREERVRRARILQAGENTGTEGGSGELGSLGSLSTTLGSNIGFNLGAIQRGENMSIFQQDIATANRDAQQGDQLFSLGSSIFQASGGIQSVGKIFKPSDPLGDFIKQKGIG